MIEPIFEHLARMPRPIQWLISLVALVAVASSAYFYVGGQRADAARKDAERALAEFQIGAEREHAEARRRVGELARQKAEVELRLSALELEKKRAEDRDAKDLAGRQARDHGEAARKALADGGYDLAEAEARKALLLRPDDIAALACRARARQQLGRTDEATADSARAVELLGRAGAVAGREVAAEVHTLAGELAEDAARLSDRAGDPQAAARHRAAARAAASAALTAFPEWPRAVGLRSRLAAD